MYSKSAGSAGPWAKAPEAPGFYVLAFDFSGFFDDEIVSKCYNILHTVHV